MSALSRSRECTTMRFGYITIPENVGDDGSSAMLMIGSLRSLAFVTMKLISMVLPVPTLAMGFQSVTVHLLRAGSSSAFRPTLSTAHPSMPSTQLIRSHTAEYSLPDGISIIASRLSCPLLRSDELKYSAAPATAGYEAELSKAYTTICWLPKVIVVVSFTFTSSVSTSNDVEKLCSLTVGTLFSVWSTMTDLLVLMMVATSMCGDASTRPPLYSA